ncbi:hypothetical protein Slin15195_G114480 [Septoria linicola]|uniref:Uncharacterized protein n=1 Tax=Septoria linicola TaxID=215465 RepID=A0A9Q9AZ99_9PEZI|nr:hypothetical protein Slin15195_G114480 [Septoria linicola]
MTAPNNEEDWVYQEVKKEKDIRAPKHISPGITDMVSPNIKSKRRRRLPRSVQDSFKIIRDYNEKSSLSKHAMKTIQQHILESVVQESKLWSLESKLQQVQRRMQKKGVSRSKVKCVMGWLRAECPRHMTGQGEAIPCAAQNGMKSSPPQAQRKQDHRRGEDDEAEEEEKKKTTEKKPQQGKGPIFELLQLKKHSKIQAWAAKYCKSPPELFKYILSGKASADLTWSNISRDQREACQKVHQNLEQGKPLTQTIVQLLLERLLPSIQPPAPTTDTTNTTDHTGKCSDDPERDAGDPGSVHDQRVIGRDNKHPKFWTPAEDEMVLNCVTRGWSNETIAAALPSPIRRTGKAIAKRKCLLKKSHPRYSTTPVVNGDSSPRPKPDSAQSPSDSCTLRANLVKQSIRSRTHPVIATSHRPAVGCRSLSREPDATIVELHAELCSADTTVEYLFLPIATPEVPVVDATTQEVTTACLAAFGGRTSFQSADILGVGCWVAIFKKTGTLTIPKRRYLQAKIKLREHMFQARHLLLTMSRVFIANISQEPDLQIAQLSKAINKAFQESSHGKPLLFLPVNPRPDRADEQGILARFASRVPIVQFYIPVLVGVRWVHVRFEPFDAFGQCWSCGISHSQGWCKDAVGLQCSD